MVNLKRQNVSEFVTPKALRPMTSNIYQTLYDLDSEKVPACFDVPHQNVGDFVVQINLPKTRKIDKNHNILNLYKWNRREYTLSTPKDLAKSSSFASFSAIGSLFNN